MVPRLLVLSALVFMVHSSPPCITRDEFGSYKVPERGGVEAPVYRYTLTNGQVTVQVMDYGATITSIKVPDSSGALEDIVLGYDTLEGYFNSDNPVFGATLGRVTNRIANGQFTLDGVTYQLSQNLGKHTIHGGFRGFDKKLWTSQMKGHEVEMTYTSPDQEEGFPGEVTVTVTYSLTEDNVLVIKYKATASKRTPINLTNHAYFNLAGQAAGAEALYKHDVSIAADYITEVDEDFIPTGKLTPVEGTEYDLRQSQNLGAAMQKTPIKGFDYNFVLTKSEGPVARVEDPNSGRWVEVFTTQPGLQLYTSNSITSIQGKATYRKHAAFCLEAQNYPDAINHQKEFPNSVYGPGDVYEQVTKYKFGVTAKEY